jgi:hypothetical protein
LRRGLFAIWGAFSLLLMAGETRHAFSGTDPQAGTNPPPRPLTFERDIRSLFQAKCCRCHGQKPRKADLDLSTPAGIQKGSESGPVIIPGKPDDSLLYDKIHNGSMPPGKKDRLSAAEVAMVRRWIAGGADLGLGHGAKTDAALLPAPTQHDVLPILLRRCTACHGLRRQEGGLSLRTKAAMLRGGKSGPAIVPGQPEESLVIKKIRAGQMPPRDRLVEASVKPIEPAETAVLARWIALGAPEVAVKPDVASASGDALVTDKDRDFWAFQPPRAVKIPTGDAEQARNPIDAFVLRKLRQKGLSLSPEADRSTLMRRAYLDLTGLPPEPAEVRAFLADSAADAYEKLIDRLLASPRYGERWGRYWLDLAGYADSEGKREQDLLRPHAWRYRDYVIQSLNADKPYDRFLLEQIAGDELADCDASTITKEIYDNLVATGFLRMAPDATWANITGYVPDRLEVIADEMDVLGSAVMGLTVKCARCHDHKFDPLPQRDYYRLLAVFKGAYDEYDWLKPDVRPGLGPVSQDVVGGRHLPHVTTAERRIWEAHNTKVQKDIDALQAALNQKAKGAVSRKASEETAGRIRALQAQRLPEPRIQALWDRGEPSPTYIYRRGDPQSPARLVGPGVPSVLTDGKTKFEVQPPWPNAKKTGRRLAFARWLTQPTQPLTGRVIVNRLWKHHFGKGIVKTLENFGKNGAPPTHPELLDWLTGQFVRDGWSLKAMHRLMMTSSTYRQSSTVTREREKLDPDNALYSRMPLVRLDAEALYDTLLLVAGRLDEKPFGPADSVDARADGLVTPVGTARGWRRAIYVRQTRKHLPTHLATFDYPQMNPNCIERRGSTVATQALYLMNNGMVYQLAEHLAQRVQREAENNREKRVELVYLIALSRLPSDVETRVGASALAQLADLWDQQSGLAGEPGKHEADLKALTTFCHAIVNSAAFLYVD